MASERVERALAESIRDAHRERNGGGSGVVGRGHCVDCRRPWPCAPFKLAAIVLDVTDVHCPHLSHEADPA